MIRVFFWSQLKFFNTLKLNFKICYYVTSYAKFNTCGLWSKHQMIILLKRNSIVSVFYGKKNKKEETHHCYGLSRASS